MTVPNFQEFMNPVLEIYNHENRAMRIQDIEMMVADYMCFSADDRALTIKSGANSVIYSRIHWSSYYLYVAGLLSKPKRGFYQITDLGKSVLASGVKIDTQFLMRYPSFVDFIKRSNPTQNNKDSSVEVHESLSEEVQDPEEKINSAIQELNVVLEDEILASLKTMEPKRFEQVVVDLMVAMNYGIGDVTRYVCDGGVDGIINEDELGLSKIYLQAKRYTNSKVNEKEMRDFVGALATNNVTKGVFITTSSFADNAKAAAQKAHGLTIRLIDGPEMAHLMRIHNLGARRKRNYDIKEFDVSYFE